MAWTPPIRRKDHRINKKEFFRLISAECNYVDENTVREMYYALVRVVKQELRRNKLARLPQLGDFGLIQQKARMALVGRKQARIGPREIVKFYPADWIREYFAARQGLPTSDSAQFLQNIPNNW